MNEEPESQEEPSSRDSQSAKDFVEKIYNLKEALNRDLTACDAKWTLFVSAALSYRYDSRLKPFPPKYITASGCDIESMISVINETPALKIILTNINDENYDELDTDVIDLVHWAIISEGNHTLRTISLDEYEILQKLLPSVQGCNVITPTQVFEVCYPENSKSEEIFKKHNEKFDACYAFHGSKLDSFYSILNHGLHQHMCKNALFGEGIYLSTELSVSLHYSPHMAAWGASLCGQLVSCVAVCEYINNPDYAKFHIGSGNGRTNNIPKKYIIIHNNEVVRVRYLFFYGSRLKDKYSPKSVALAWISRNKYLLTVCCYTLFLASIGIANSGGGLYFKHIINKKTSDIMKIFKKLFLEDT